jgi:hypothetical protein
MWIVTHSEPLAQFVEQHSNVKPIRLHMVKGKTCLEGIPSGWRSPDADDES